MTTNIATTPLQRPKVPPGLLQGPILPMMLRLAAPTIVVLVVQTLVGVLETYFIGFLGTEALGGVALVFPILMLMQMTANGGIGGGVSSAVARAMGAGKRDDAEALLWHALCVAALFGLAFAALAILGGPALYRSMGGRDAVLASALTYSNVVFAGAIPLWVVALLSAALRGAGEVKIPALVSLVGAAALVPLSPALIFGWGPLPALGIAGGGVAVVLYYLIAGALLLRYLRSARSPLTLRPGPLRAQHFRDILGVGLLSAVGTLQVNLTVTVVTAAVGLFGAAAIAAYGVASRLEYVLIPLLFGLGTAIVTMVGTNIGAGQPERAERIAWTGAALAFCVTEAVGLLVAVFPHGWLGLFSQDPRGAAHGRAVPGTHGPGLRRGGHHHGAVLCRPGHAARAVARARGHRAHAAGGRGRLDRGGAVRRGAGGAVPHRRGRRRGGGRDRDGQPAGAGGAQREDLTRQGLDAAFMPACRAG